MEHILVKVYKGRATQATVFSQRARMHRLTRYWWENISLRRGDACND
jgi:hypothetical protein